MARALNPARAEPDRILWVVGTPSMQDTARLLVLLTRFGSTLSEAFAEVAPSRDGAMQASVSPVDEGRRSAYGPVRWRSIAAAP